MWIAEERLARALNMATTFENVRLASYDEEGKIKDSHDASFKLDVTENSGSLTINFVNGMLSYFSQIWK